MHVRDFKIGLSVCLVLSLSDHGGDLHDGVFLPTLPLHDDDDDHALPLLQDGTTTGQDNN